MKHQIFVVDDHAITRAGYYYIINEEMDMAVCGEAASAMEALEKIEAAMPDLVITDLSMEGMSGLELVKHLHAQYPDLPVLVVSMHDESLYADRALRAGAKGYIMKTELDTAVVTAIRRIMAGGLFVSEPLSNKIFQMFSGGKADLSRSPVEAFSDRELEVFESLGNGHSTRQIAEAMLVSPKTVDSYRARIKKKLGIKTHADLLKHAVRWIRDHEDV